MGLGACANTTGGLAVDGGFNPNPGADAARSQAPQAGDTCVDGGDFSVLAGIFAGSSRRYNEDCGFLNAFNTIYNNPQSTVEEKAVALRALANERPEFGRQLEQVVQAIQDGRNPLFPALPNDAVINCGVGEEIARTADTRTHVITSCTPGRTGPV
ncbi:MAG: hypothetical protein GW903_08860 [Alphaproteobacteria bacterium]|nr:hypothetical protein [Alphaproteobacteria bacterium]NCQ88918.1 hypothetical protein [Alphaproteobacteria bacterium]